jgi:hypothetical protein
VKSYITSDGQFHRSAPPPLAPASARLYVRREDGEWMELRGMEPYRPSAALRDFDATGFAVSSPQPIDPAVFDAVLSHIHAALEVIERMGAPSAPPAPPGPRWYLAWHNRATGHGGRGAHGGRRLADASSGRGGDPGVRAGLPRAGVVAGAGKRGKRWVRSGSMR